MEIIRENVRCDVDVSFELTDEEKAKTICEDLVELFKTKGAFIRMYDPVIRSLDGNYIKIHFTEFNEADVDSESISHTFVDTVLRNINYVKKVYCVMVQPWSNTRMQNNSPERKCKKCGSKMVIRSGDKGQFYGCSSFPRCRHTENI